MKDFCAATGELILWASMIDGQLNQAILGQLALPEHPMIEPVVAQLDARPKCELLRKRAKLIKNKGWKDGLTNWVQQVEEVNKTRNIVAHHSIRIKDGVIRLHSDQLSKIMSSLDTGEGKIRPGKGKGLADILEWIEQAKKAYAAGDEVLANLKRFRELAATMDKEADERVYMVAARDEAGDQHMFVSGDLDRALGAHRDLTARFGEVQTNDALADAIRKHGG